MYQNIDNHISSDLRAVFNDGAKAYVGLLTDENWQSWLRVGHALAAAHELAAEVTGASSGKGFNTFMKTWYGLYPHLANIDKSTRSHTTRCWLEREEINKWRDTLGESERLRLNHPRVVYAAYQKKTVSGLNAKREKEPSPYAKLSASVIKLEEENDRLKKQLRGRDGDVHFSLLDKDAAIADTLVMSLNPDRAKNVAEHIRRKLGKKVEKAAA